MPREFTCRGCGYLVLSLRGRPDEESGLCLRCLGSGAPSAVDPLPFMTGDYIGAISLQRLPAPSPFHPGDIVRLRTGGARMRVELVEGPLIYCAWSDETGAPVGDPFLADALKAAGVTAAMRVIERVSWAVIVVALVILGIWICR